MTFFQPTALSRFLASSLSLARWAATLALGAALAAPLAAQCEVEVITDLGTPFVGEVGLTKVQTDVGTDGVRRWVSWRKVSPTASVFLRARGDDGSVVLFNAGGDDPSLWIAMDGDIVVAGFPGNETATVRNLVLLSSSVDLPKPVGASDNYGRACDVEQLGPNEYLVAVSATGTGGVQEGEVYLFHVLNGSIVQQETVVSPTPQGGSFFGSGLALDNGNLIISQHAWDSGLFVNTGAAHFYRYTDPTLPGPLTVTHELTQSIFSGDNNYFGWKPAVDGDLIIIGSPLYDHPTLGADFGLATLYAWDGSSFGFITAAIGSSPGDKLGFDTAVKGTRALAGAPGDQAVHVYDTATVGLVPLIPGMNQWVVRPGAPSSGFGESVAATKGHVVVAAPYSAQSAEPGIGALHDFLAMDFHVDLPSRLAADPFTMELLPKVLGDSGACPGAAFELVFEFVPSGPSGFLMVGFSELSAPAKGGVLYPNPFKILNLPAPSAAYTLPSILPPGNPAYSLYVQAWYLQPQVGPFGYLATNGLRIDAPSSL